MNIKIDKNFPNIKLSIKLLDQKYLDDDGKIKKEYQFKLNFPEFGIINSKISSKKDKKFDTYLFLPRAKERIDEGGLRTKGYFKFSYKSINNKWYFCNIGGNLIKPVDEELEKIIRKYTKSNNLDLKELPLITVITVVYNGEKYLEETIQSVINQTYPNIEYIIIDDAMNKGIKLANGIWINFMNAGDLFANAEVLMRINFHRYREQSLIYGNKIQNGEVILPIDIERLEVGEIMACHQAMFFNKSLLGYELFYNIKYKIYGDYELVNRIYLKNPRNLTYIDEVICIFRGDGISSKKSFQKRRDKYSILLKSYGIFGLLRGVIYRLRKGMS